MKLSVLNAVGGLCLLGVSCSSGQQPISTASASSTISINAVGLEESSGVAPSLNNPGWFYTHNDDDNPMQYWKFNLSGKVQGPYVLPDIVNRDVEDMAAAKIDGRSYLYFADIGDNQARYDSIRIYRILEPTATSGEQRKVDVFTIKYPNGAMNSEAFFVNPKNGDFWIIEKTSNKAARILWCSSPKPGNNIVREVGNVSVGSAIAATRLITGASVSQDGRFVILRTYVEAFEFEAGDDLLDWWEQTPKKIKLNVEGQGEAICYSRDGDQIITTSEGVPCQASMIQAKRE